MFQKPSVRRTVLRCEQLEERLALDATSFVTSLYTNLLNRAPDSAGLSFWVQQIQNGMPNHDVAKDFWESPEHRGIQVDFFYQTYLHRAADADGRAHWVNEFMNGDLTELPMAAVFLNSQEYLNNHSTPNAFISGLYLDILGRLPSTDEMNFWLNALAVNGAFAVTGAILTSQESFTDIVAADYSKYLNRTPDASGLDHFLSGLDTGQASVESVALDILGSVEYANTH
jgi:hypothetical protein